MFLLPLIMEEISILEIKKNGIEVRGEVVKEALVSTGYGKVWKYNVKYIDSQQDTFNVSNTLNIGYKKYYKGDILLVLYDKNKPEKAVLKDDLKDPYRVVQFIFSVLLFLISIFHFYRFKNK